MGRQRWKRWIGWGLVAVAWFVLYIDDWGRDLVSHSAQMSENARNEELRPLKRLEPSAGLVEGLKWAGNRIRNVEYIGDSSDGNTTLVLFVRTNRLLRTKEDIIMTIEDRGDLRVVSGSSVSRLELGDLGRNPRNLRRLRAELLDVLGGSTLGAIASDYPIR